MVNRLEESILKIPVIGCLYVSKKQPSLLDNEAFINYRLTYGPFTSFVFGVAQTTLLYYLLKSLE